MVDQLTATERNLELAQALNPAYWRISGPDGSDASAIRDAVRRRIAKTPGDWGLA